MVATVMTVAFEGITARLVTVEVQLASGLPAFTIVGLPDKAVSEARERVRAALSAIGLALPTDRITVNLSPADLPKEGSHYDLPIALALLTAMGALPSDALEGLFAMGELGLDASIRPVGGVLPAALRAGQEDASLICPTANGSEAAFAGAAPIVAAPHLMAVINHVKGSHLLTPPEPLIADGGEALPDLRDVKGQESAKRALEVAAAGGHHLLMIGPPGSGKSMLAARLPGLLPPMTPMEILAASTIRSVAGLLTDGGLSSRRPYRNPHHTASQAALIGGGRTAKPGEISLAHAGVLFLDELPEFPRAALESLRQPLESREAVIARAEAHVTYPAHFQLIAAMNPCRCGYLGDAALACTKAPKCGQDYQAKLSGPLFDRFDLVIEVPAVSAKDLSVPKAKEGSNEVAARVLTARKVQEDRGHGFGLPAGKRVNAALEGDVLEQAVPLDGAATKLMQHAAETMRLSARGYHRLLRVARTLADLDGQDDVTEPHIAEALSYRRLSPQAVLGGAGGLIHH